MNIIFILSSMPMAISFLGLKRQTLVDSFQHHINIVMLMLLEQPQFDHLALVPWPCLDQPQLDWVQGVSMIENWLSNNVGPRLSRWTWEDSGHHYKIAVSFRWDRDRLLFVMVWA